MAKQGGTRVTRSSRSKRKVSSHKDEVLFFERANAAVEDTKKKVMERVETVETSLVGENLSINLCPFCKQYKATYKIVQRRSADEGGTAEFWCKNNFCGRRWKGPP